MKNILYKLFHGQTPKWDSNNSAAAKAEAIKKRIASERHYFSTIMSDENFTRFKKLERLHRDRHSIQYMDTYINAFRLGAMIMCAVFMGEDEQHEYDDEF